MAKIEFSIAVRRPVEEVFAYLTDPANLPEWQSSAIEGRMEAAGPMAKGARFVEARKFMGRRFESTLEVTEYDPPRRFAFRVVSGPVPFRADHPLEPSDGGTQLSVVGEGESGGFFKAAEPPVIRTARRQTKTDFEALRNLS